MMTADIEPIRYQVKSIDVRDKKGKLFAQMSSDRKRIRIASHDRAVELFINEDGQLEQAM
ncbi:MAG: hypothetical protein MR773_01850 [Eubacterium coprostanoligenes]|nr:hypothetical protein [Eubacterium coprostanoligenes]